MLRNITKSIVIKSPSKKEAVAVSRHRQGALASWKLQARRQPEDDEVGRAGRRGWFFVARPDYRRRRGPDSAGAGATPMTKAQRRNHAALGGGSPITRSTFGSAASASRASIKTAAFQASAAAVEQSGIGRSVAGS